MTSKDKIIINNTIDGEPADQYEARQTSATKGAGKAAYTSIDTRRRAPKPVAKHDPYIWGIYIMILIVSVVELFSASSSEIRGSNIYGPLISHCMHLAVGLGIILFIQNVHYAYFSRFAVICALGSLALLIYGSFFGESINGAQRAINLPGFSLQPAELVKLTVVVFLATILGRTQRPGGVSTRGVTTVAIVVMVFSGILWINGLTNTILLMGVSMAMFLIGGIKWRTFFIVLGIYCACAGALYMFKDAREKSTEFDRVGIESTGMAQVEEDHSIGRSKTHSGRFKDYMRGVQPDDKVTDKNRQVFYAKMAQANGGLLGKGPGNSRESARLPLAFSDYIYSIIVEDTGFIGGIALLLLYLFLLARAGRIAYKCRRAFPAFLIMGCAVLIVFQALVHMSIVTGVAPVSGQPLPLISKGGTSILVMSTAIGIMLSVSRYAVKTDNRKENKEEAKILPEDMLAENVTVSQG